VKEDGVIGGRGQYVAVKQNESNLLVILLTRGLLAHTIITVGSILGLEQKNPSFTATQQS
jgi:hypothetical protein